MAVSLKTASYFLHLLRVLDAKSAADFGSGFSSYVLGKFADETHHYVDAVSVDDDPEWLEKTEAFLGFRHVYTELMSWEHYQHVHFQHDVALYDLASGDVRNAGMELVCRRTKSGGVVLVDDMHAATHRETIEGIAKRFRWDLYFLYDWTQDEYGRFAALLVKP